MLIAAAIAIGVIGIQPEAGRAGFEAIAVSPHAIRLFWKWEDSARKSILASHRLYRNGVRLADFDPQSREYIDAGLTPDTVYHYRLVRRLNDGDTPAGEYVERTFPLFPGAEAPMKRTSAARALPVAQFDVVVTQASSGGVAAAIEAGRRGLRVALIEPSTRLGGMPVNGLSATDLRRPEHASGFLVEFRDRTRALYRANGISATGLAYEPRIAHQAMKSLLFETPFVTVFRRTRLAGVRTVSVERQGAPDSLDRIATPTAVSPNFRLYPEMSPPAPPRQTILRRRVQSVIVEELDSSGRPTGRRALFQAPVFIDATDCGDLAAQAGAPFRIGREARSAAEPHNGVIYYDRAADRALPGSTGRADTALQAYAYLITVKDYGPEADRTIPRPPTYRRENYLHTPAWKDSWAATSGKMPDGRYELNQHPQGSDLQGINSLYPTGSYEERERIEKRYREHVLGYLYYIQTEQGMKRLGLPDDEYRDTDGFPSLLYVREGRRIVGRVLPTEADISHARERLCPDSIGIGDYPMDSHAVRPKTDWTTPDMGEGEWWLVKQTPWHAIPLGVMVPRQLENVFVTTAVSSTHVSYGTYRMEPVRMAFGQAAGIAASLCVRYGLSAGEVPARQVQEELLQPQGAGRTADVFLHYFPDLLPSARHYAAIQYLAVRGFVGTGQENFRPEAATTRAEMARCLHLLANRSALPPGERSRDTAVFPDTLRYERNYMGRPASRAAAQAAAALPEPDRPVTRGEAAVWLMRVLGDETPGSPAPDATIYSKVYSKVYSDLTDPQIRHAALALRDRGVSPRLWADGGKTDPSGELLFEPDAPLRRADFFAALYLVQRGIGPSFDDNPVDLYEDRLPMRPK